MWVWKTVHGASVQRKIGSRQARYGRAADCSAGSFIRPAGGSIPPASSDTAGGLMTSPDKNKRENLTAGHSLRWSADKAPKLSQLKTICYCWPNFVWSPLHFEVSTSSYRLNWFEASWRLNSLDLLSLTLHGREASQLAEFQSGFSRKIVFWPTALHYV